MNTAEATELLKRSLLPDQLRQVLAAFGQHQIGDICRWDGERWEALTGPEAEEEGSEAFSAVYDLLIALEDLAGIAPADLALPDPAEAWDQAKERAYDAYNRLEGLMEDWGDELNDLGQRENEATTPDSQME